MNDVSKKKSKGLLFAGFAAIVLVALYAVVGYWVAPKILQSMGSKLVAEKTGLNLEFKSVRLNPFTFTADFEDLSLGQAEKKPFLTMAQLFADFEIRSLLAPPYRFKLIRLVSADERLNILPDGRFDFAPLLEEIAKQTARSRRGGAAAEVLVEQLRVEASKITVTDPARSSDPIVTVYPVSGEFTNLSTVEGQTGSYDLRGTIVDIGSIHDSGKVSIAPLRLEGRLEIGPLGLRPAWALAQELTRFNVTDGSVHLELSYTAELQKDGYDFRVRDGNLTLSGLKLADKQHPFEFGRLAELKIRGIDIDGPSKTAAVDAVEVSGAELTLWIRPDGTSGIFDVLTLNTSDPSETQTQTRDAGLPAFLDGWQARLERTTVLEARLRYEDQRSEPPKIGHCFHAVVHHRRRLRRYRDKTSRHPGCCCVRDAHLRLVESGWHDRAESGPRFDTVGVHGGSRTA